MAYRRGHSGGISQCQKCLKGKRFDQQTCKGCDKKINVICGTCWAKMGYCSDCDSTEWESVQSYKDYKAWQASRA